MTNDGQAHAGDRACLPSDGIELFRTEIRRREHLNGRRTLDRWKHVASRPRLAHSNATCASGPIRTQATLNRGESE